MTSFYHCEMANKKDINKIKKLLNKELSFGLATDESVETLLHHQQCMVLFRKNELIGIGVVKK